jgi:hypothetical protein
MQRLAVNSTRSFILTDMTGRKASSTRKVLIPNVEIEVPFRKVIVFVSAAPAAIIAALGVGVLLGFVPGAAAFGAIEAAAFYLFERRSRKGLQLRTYELLRDKNTARTSVLTMCGVEVNPYGPGPAMVRTSTVLLNRDRAAELHDTLGMYSPTGPAAALTGRIKRANAAAARQVHTELADVFRPSAAAR